MKKQNMFSRRFRMGGYSAFTVIMLVCILVAVNLIVGTLPSSYTQLDLTSQSLYSLSDQTLRIASALQTDVTFYLLATTGAEDNTISRILDKYDELSDHIHVEYVDPVANPTFLTPYELDVNQLYTNSVLAVSGARHRLVSYDKIYVTNVSYDYYGNTVTETSFDGENALTNALHYVTATKLPKVYALTGHGETALEDAFISLMQQDNLEYAMLSLLAVDSVPADADALIINAPSADLSEDEAAMLLSYLENGGSILLTTDYINEGAMPNLVSVTSEMGMSPNTGLVVEGDSSRHLSMYNYYLLPNLADHEITLPLKSAGYYVLLPITQSISKTIKATVTPLFTTSESAYLKQSGLETQVLDKEEGDETGEFIVGALAEKNDASLCWVTTKEFLNSSVSTIVSGGNYEMAMNTLNYMCQQVESISIRSKPLSANTLSVTSSGYYTCSILMVGVLPVAMLALGIVVYIRRKRR